MRDDRAITLQDIADRVGVTRSTVSYAITGRGRVSADTKQKVLAAARDLGYQPNTLARRLRGSRTGIIALRLPRHTSKMPYYMEATFGVAEEAEGNGMVVSLVTGDVGRSADLQRLHADGVILLDPAIDDPSAHTILGGALPVVTGEPVPPGLLPGQATVGSDHESAVTGLMDHLGRRGARRPALIVPDLQSHWAMSVRRAFDRWCLERGIVGETVSVARPVLPDAVRASVAELLGRAGTIDAIVAGSDGIVLNVITSAEQLGRKVGADLLVATVVDSDLLELTRPSVTALDLQPREFGRRCVRALLAVLDEDAGESRVHVHDTVPIVLRRRESTAHSLAARV